MKASEGKLGRVFIIRLNDGDKIPESIERFAEEKGIFTGQVILIGSIGAGQVVVGPRDSLQMPPDPMVLPVDGSHEVLGIGILAPDIDGKPVLHIHASLGRSEQTLTGCLRLGADIWLVGEVIIYEILGTEVSRIKDEKSGLVLLESR
jgi:predicted DNA-binding protein with PD1-like motif